MYNKLYYIQYRDRSLKALTWYKLCICNTLLSFLCNVLLSRLYFGFCSSIFTILHGSWLDRCSHFIWILFLHTKSIRFTVTVFIKAVAKLFVFVRCICDLLHLAWRPFKTVIQPAQYIYNTFWLINLVLSLITNKGVSKSNYIYLINEEHIWNCENCIFI